MPRPRRFAFGRSISSTSPLHAAGGKRGVGIAAAVAVVALAVAFFGLWLRLQALERRVAALEAPATPTRPRPDAGVSQSVTAIWSCSGVVPPAALPEFLARHGRDVFACNEERERAGVVLAGTVLVRVRFDPSGAATHVRFAGPLRDAPLEACVVGRARAWRVPPLNARGCATIELPFRIGPRAPDAGSP